MPVPTYRVKNQNDAPPRSALGNGYGRRMYGRSAAKRLIRSPEAGFLLFHTALNFVFKKVARAHCAHKQIYTDAPITVRSKRSALLYRSFAYFRLARPRLQFGCQGGLSHSRCREGGLKSAVVSPEPEERCHEHQAP